MHYCTGFVFLQWTRSGKFAAAQQLSMIEETHANAGCFRVYRHFQVHPRQSTVGTAVKKEDTFTFT